MDASDRRAYIDWARGIAVLVMIEAHTTDAWTRPLAKQSIGFRNATVLGGFAAPLFLWLAGLGVILAATRASARTGSRSAAVDSVCRRGLEIFLLAFLFRLQAFVLSPGSHPVTLFRVDILNVMGPAMAVTGLLWFACTRPVARVVTFAATAGAIAMATPIVRAAPWVDRLPIWVQWHLRPSGEHTTFTLLPWAGFVFAGAAIGSLVATARGPSAERRVLAGIAAVASALVAAGFWTASRPSIYQSASFWTSSPTWFAIRAGIVMIAFATLFAVEEISRALAGRYGASTLFRLFVVGWQAPLARLGRASLFIYWIHVELVYGYASWLWRGRLPLWATWIAYALFCALMYGAVVVRDRIVASWRRITPDTSLVFKPRT